MRFLIHGRRARIFGQIWPDFGQILTRFGQIWPDFDQIWSDFDQIWPDVDQIWWKNTDLQIQGDLETLQENQV